MAATHQDLANTSARLRAVEAELEQAEAEAALHRSAAEHAAAIAEKYAEERDSSRAELERYASRQMVWHFLGGPCKSDELGLRKHVTVPCIRDSVGQYPSPPISQQYIYTGV